MDFPISLAPDSTLPLSRQLTVELRESILSGRIRPGHHLPSARELGESLSVSRSTVVKAYKQLQGEGILETQVGSGTYVRRSLTLSAVGDNRSVQRRADPPLSSMSNLSRAILNVELSLATSGDMPELNYGCSSADLLPVRQWSDLFGRHCRTLSRPRSSSDHEVFGYRPLREALAAYLRRSKAVQCSADQVIVFSGSQNATQYIASLLINEDDLVVVENPGYAGTRNSLEARGARIETIDVDENGLRVEDLEKIEQQCKLVCASLSHHDPTGAILSMERRKRLLAWAERTNAYILEDAWDSDYHYSPPALPALQGLDKSDRVFYSYSFWKLLFPIVTTGVLVIPQHMIELFTKAKLLNERQFAPLEQYALTDFINRGHLECHISKSRAIYESRRQALIFNLKQKFRESVQIPRYTAGLHQLIQFHSDLEESQVLECARRAKLPMVSTRSYYVQNPVDLEFLIPFGVLEKESIAINVCDFAEHMDHAVV
jgi:GntR family transcriptional regulator / MocR family aminotransferase